jgi:hypothetical protein
MYSLSAMETRPYILPLDLTQAAAAAEAEIRKTIEHVEGGYLVHRQVAIIHIDENGVRAELTANELIAFLSYLRPLTLDSATPTKRSTPEPKLSSPAGKSILKFTSLYFDEIRAQICKGKKQSLGTTTHAALVAIAGWLSSHFGMESPAVTGVAAAILIAALTATKGAFCKMKASDAKASIEAASKNR